MPIKTNPHSYCSETDSLSQDARGVSAGSPGDLFSVPAVRPAVADPQVVGDRIRQRLLDLFAPELASAPDVDGTPGGGVSYGFINTTVNEDKATGGAFRVFRDGHWHEGGESADSLMVLAEAARCARFVDYVGDLADKWILLENLADRDKALLVRPADSSRYFKEGRRRIKGKIYHRLGRWYNCPGLLLSLTFAPKLISREDAWRQARMMSREFMNRVNRWRVRHGMPRAKYLSVIEVQPGTGYPHLHLVFPHLKWLAPTAFMVETWGQEWQSVDYKIKDSFSPVAYICKYVTKLEGWSDVALSYIWANGTRLYTMSRAYVLPDLSDRRVAEWRFLCMTTEAKARALVMRGGGYASLEGGDELVVGMANGGDT